MKIFNTLIKTVAIAAALVFTGCEKEKEKEQSLSDLGRKLCGEWKLETPAETNVYLAFAADMTFEEYQRLDEGGYELRRGTWQLDQSLLSGKYNDSCRRCDSAGGGCTQGSRGSCTESGGRSNPRKH